MTNVSGSKASPTICLNMIVRDEADCIERCLSSVRPVISHWVICDTGSIDNTPEIVQSVLRGIPGNLYRDEWRDFAYNRNLGLGRARERADYHLILDADFTIEIDPEYASSRLTADAYRLPFESNVDWGTTRLVKDSHRWHFRGRAHEYIYSDTAAPAEWLPSLVITHHEDGGNREKRLSNYLDLLLLDYKDNPQNSRAVFYIAQTHNDVGDKATALEWYERRVVMEGGDEERWYSAYQMARCKQALGRPWPEVLHTYLEAYEMRPSRLEPLLQVCLVNRTIGHFELNYLLSSPALEGTYPDDILFIEKPTYLYGLLMERAIACFYLGKFPEAKNHFERILSLGELLPDSYERATRKYLDLISKGSGCDGIATGSEV